MQDCTIRDTLAWVREERRQALKSLSFIGRDVERVLEELSNKLPAVAASEARKENIVQELRAVVVERHLAAKHDLDMRHYVDKRMALGLTQLRALSSSGEVSRRTPNILRKACGFTRVMISSVRGSKWLPDTIRYEDAGKLDSARSEEH